MAAHGSSVRARSHQPLAAQGRSRLDSRRYRICDGRHNRTVGTDLRRAARRIADRPGHRDPPPSRSHRAGRLAHRTLAGAVMGQREGVVVRTLAHGERGRFRRAASRFRPPGRARSGGEGTFRRAQQGLSSRGPIRPFELSAAHRGAAGRDRRTAMAGDHRRGSFTGASLPLLWRNGCADLGGPGAAPDLAECQCSSSRAGRRSALTLSTLSREAARSDPGRNARPAVAQPAILRPAGAG